jgi:hypothetical protein
VSAPTTKELPFAFAAPRLPPHPFCDNSEIEANRETMLPVAQAHTATAEIMGVAIQAAAPIANDRTLSPLGQRQAFTERVAKPSLTKLRHHEAALNQAELKNQADQAALFAVPEPSTPASVIERQERLALAQAFGAKPENQRRQLLEAAMTGRDPALRAALANSHSAITGLGEPLVAMLRREEEGRRVDLDVLERLRREEQRIGAAKATVKIAIDALERASDREQLKAAKLATMRRSDLSAKEASDFITNHGLSAYKALPA